MLDFQFFMPTRLIFGPGCLDRLGDTPFLPRGNKAMIVVSSGGSMLKNGYLARVQGLLSQQGVQSVVFDKIRPNPESDQVDEAAATCRSLGVNFIVGLGGGSSIDSAKAIALLAANDGVYWDYMRSGSGGRKAPDHPALPVVAIPTTAGTGTEADPWTVISKSGGQEKVGWGNPSTFPALSLVDPKLMLTVPPNQTAFTGMDAFFHAVESFLNTNRSPMNDMLALEAVNVISGFLPATVADGSSLEARTAMAWASTAAGICESIGGCISHHSMEHALSAFNPDLPHGLGLALLSVPYFTRLGELNPERFLDLAEAMESEAFDVDEDIAESEGPRLFIEELERLLENSGFGKTRLSDYGFKSEQAEALADNAFDVMGALFEVTPAVLTRRDVADIFRTAIEA
ncbi:MAG: iron-containing alcohol dehydrogenase [Desulfovibrionaceae bacterium]